MVDIEKEEKERIAKKRKEKYGQYIRHSVTGGFTTKTRKRLLGFTKGLSGRDKSKNDFWNDVRDQARMGLINQEIFLETAPLDQVEQVVTPDTLKPIVESLLWHPVVDQAQPDLRTARIAQLFVDCGFAYLRSMKQDLVTKSHERTLDEATDLINFLVESFKPEGEKRYLRQITP